MTLPYFIDDFAGIGGVIKQRPEDFFVQELPLYEPSGEGEHVYVEIQKVGVTTFDAITRIARALNVSSRDIGYAGLKDASAITRQILSIPGTTEEAVMKLQLENITPQWAMRHGNKLRIGHLVGNRFAIRIRHVDPTAVIRLRPVLARLEQRGMPNYFGEQRFGRRGDNHLLGAALVRGDNEGLLKLLLGTPHPQIDDPQQLKAREAYDRGELEDSMRAWPRRSGMERRVLARLIKTGKPAAAVRAIDFKLRNLWISALQSHGFNLVVAERIRAGTLDRIIDGDLAEKHDNGAVFRVEDPAAEQPRCDVFDISPTGPLLGYRMTQPTGEALRIEEAALGSLGLQPSDFRGGIDVKSRGARRALRVRPRDIQLQGGVDEHGPHITVAFTLPAGSFATVLLREIMRNDQL